MSKKIVEKDFSINGMTMTSMIKQFLTYKRMPFINLQEGPGLKNLFELLILHKLGRHMVQLEIHYPKVYSFCMRVRNSLIFRYNHYRRLLLAKVSRK